MPSDYQKQIKEIFGTADLDELRELAKMLKINHPNPRNAGRKAQLTPDQIVEVLELHRKGIGNTEIAKQFGVCLLYTSPSPRDRSVSRMPSSA